jgi:methionine sulfoxide reductase heme-binding subunit
MGDGSLVSTQLLWFATRGAGIVSLILFSAVACLGLLAAARAQSARWPRFLTVELHRNLALLSVTFLAIHVVTAVLDPFTSLGIAAAVVPLASSYRPLAVTLGVISVDLTLAVIVTSLLRDRVGQRAWRGIHWVSYASWPLAVAHTITAGSDSFALWMLGVTGVCVLAVGACLLWRITAGGTNRSRLAAVTGGVADPVALDSAWRHD